MSETQETLYDQIKDIHLYGPRLSGEPEVVHEIEDIWRCNPDAPEHNYPLIRDEISALLNAVPDPFPQDWEAPDSFEELTEKQRKELANIMLVNPLCHHFDRVMVLHWYQRVISEAIVFRNNDRAKQ